MDPHLLEKRVSDALRYLRNQKDQLAKLRGRVARLEQTMNLCLGSDAALWLFRNRGERMDPTVPIFDEGRAEFHAARYRFAASYVRGQQVLDIACGTGYGCRMLIELGAAQSVTGMDLAEDALNYARQTHGVAGTVFLSGDVTRIPADDRSFDVVVSFETIEHVEHSELAVQEFARVLRPEGCLICSTPNQWPLAIAPFHRRVFDRDSFTALLRPHFSQLQLFNQNSGTEFEFNRGQPAGIVPTTSENEHLAECFLALCRI